MALAGQGDFDPGVLLDDFESGALTSAGGTCAFNAQMVRGGISSAQMFSDLGTTMRLDRPIKVSNLTTARTFGFWIYLEAPAQTLPKMSIAFSSKTDVSKAMVTNFYPQKSGWNYVVLERAKFYSYNGETWANPMTTVRFTIDATLGVRTVLYLDELRMNPLWRPKVVFTFDDQYSSAYYEAFPYMATKGMNGTMYVITSFLLNRPSPEYCTVGQLNEMYAAGWDMSNHSSTHRHFASLTYDEVMKDYNDARIALIRNGWTRRNCHLDVAYPYGETSDTIFQVMKDIATLNARGTAGSVQYVYQTNPLLTRAELVGGPTYTVAQAKAKIDQAINEGGACIFLFHKVVPDYATISSTNDIHVSDFRAIVDYVATKKAASLCDVPTISEYYQGLQRQRSVANDIAF